MLCSYGPVANGSYQKLYFVDPNQEKLEIFKQFKLEKVNSTKFRVSLNKGSPNLLSSNGIMRENDYRVLFCHSTTYKGGEKCQYSEL